MGNIHFVAMAAVVLRHLIGAVSIHKFGMWKKVRVTSDEKEARKLQEGHGGWVSPMEKVSLFMHSYVHFLYIVAYNVKGKCG